MTERLTYRQTNALRNLGQRLAEQLQLDQYARQTDWPTEDFLDHLDGVRALEAIDIMCGKPGDRDYDQLRWSAVSAVGRIRGMEDGEQTLVDAIRNASVQDGEM